MQCRVVMAEKTVKILILRLSSIGDILLTTPFIRMVRSRFPTAHISYIVKKEFAVLLQQNPHINNLIIFDSKEGYSGLKKLRAQLQKENFTYIYDLHNNLRTNRLVKGLHSAQLYQIDKSKLKRALLVYLKLNLFSQITRIPERYLSVGKAQNIKDDGKGLELFFDTQSEEKVNNILAQHNIQNKRFICIGPGAAHFTKMWPIKKVMQLTNTITQNHKISVLFLGGKNEAELIPESTNPLIINLAGQLSLMESAIVLKQSIGLVCNDSGLMHLASAVNTPLVTVFGSTTQQLGFAPYRSQSVVLENNALWCRPCTHIGRKKCPLGHLNCLNTISAEMVYNAIKRKFL